MNKYRNALLVSALAALPSIASANFTATANTTTVLSSGTTVTGTIYIEDDATLSLGGSIERSNPIVLLGSGRIQTGGSGQSDTFSGGISGSYTLSVSGPGVLSFGGLTPASTFSLNADSNVVFNSSVGIDQLHVATGATLTMSTNGGHVLNVATQAFSFTDHSYPTIDLKDNDAVIGSVYVNGGPDSTFDIVNQLASGYNSGAWTGTGIGSSAVSPTDGTSVGYATASDLGVSTFDGVSVSGSDTLIKFTYGGDANLDGQVDFSDLSILVNNYLDAGVWDQGDFNYTGGVTSGDFSILVNNYGLGVGDPLGQLDSVQRAVVVPEPSCVLSAGLASLAGISCRRRR